MSYKLVFLVLFLLIIHSGHAQNILFVGNSLSYTNDMPVILEQLGKDNGAKISTKCICLPNYGLEDHMNDGLVETEIKRGSYDFVIFQQGPSSQAYGRESLLQFGKQLSVLALENEAVPAYLIVWPSKTYYQTFDGVIKNHTDASEANSASLIPVGTVWQRLNQEHEKYQLYGPDGFHPSRLGSLLEALVILKYLQPDLKLIDLKSDAIDEVFDNPTQAQAFLKILSAYLNEL